MKNLYLKDLPTEQITEGLRVLSYRGTPGTVTQVLSLPEGPEIHVNWDNGNQSKFRLAWEVMEPRISVLHKHGHVRQG